MAAHWPGPAGLHRASVRLPVEGELPALGGATGWLNAPPLTVAGLRGEVVLVGFWTYTCINWLRQLPYLRAWAAKYSGHGLVVVGVHTPEFGFESDVDNVSRAVLVPRRRGTGPASHLYGPGGTETQSLGPVRGPDDGGTGHHPAQGSIIRRYIIWRNRHADDRRRRAVVAKANVA
jgi:thiol-disulfide isomerase/thioredoxin